MLLLGAAPAPGQHPADVPLERDGLVPGFVAELLVPGPLGVGLPATQHGLQKAVARAALPPFRRFGLRSTLRDSNLL